MSLMKLKPLMTPAKSPVENVDLNSSAVCFISSIVCRMRATVDGANVSTASSTGSTTASRMSRIGWTMSL